MTITKNALTTVTNAVEKIIRDGLDEAKILCSGESCVTFRVPDAVDKQKVSVFLYDVHEDLDARLGEARCIDDASGSWRPSRMFLRFSYLITCWRKNNLEGKVEVTEFASEIGSNQERESKALELPQIVLDALLRNRTLEGIPGAYCRVLPPSESLDALGQFWQALKGPNNKNPRLCMSYAVTVPVDVPMPYAERTQAVSPVLEESTSVIAMDSPLRAAWDAAMEAVEMRYDALVSITSLGGNFDSFDNLASMRAALDGQHGPFANVAAPLTRMVSCIVADARTTGRVPQGLAGKEVDESELMLLVRSLRAFLDSHDDHSEVLPPDVQAKHAKPGPNVADDLAVKLWFRKVLVPRYRDQRPLRLSAILERARAAGLEKKLDPVLILSGLLIASCRDALQVVATMALLQAWVFSSDAEAAKERESTNA